MKLLKIKNVMALCIATIIAFSPTMTSMADFREAGTFKVDGEKDSGIYKSGKNGNLYYLTNVGGMTVYTPYTHNMPGNIMFKMMFTGLFDIYKTGIGSNYPTTGAKFNAPNGLNNINGINTSYYVKTVSLGGLNNRVGPAVEAEPASTDLHQFAPNYNVEFRYGGVAINADTGSGSVMSNPAFPSDQLSASNNGGEKREYTVYDKAGNPTDSVTMYGTSNLFVWDSANFVERWPGSSGVPTNVPNPTYEGVAEQVFEKWADTIQLLKKVCQKWRAFLMGERYSLSPYLCPPIFQIR